MRNKLIFVLLLFIISPSFIFGQTTWEADVSWDANTEDDLAGYKVYIGEKSVANGDAATYKIVVNIGNKTTHTWINLKSDIIYYFAVKAYDTSGNNSDYSNEVAHSFQTPEPPPPVDTTPPGAPKITVEVVIKVQVN